MAAPEDVVVALRHIAGSTARVVKRTSAEVRSYARRRGVSDDYLRGGVEMLCATAVVAGAYIAYRRGAVVYRNVADLPTRVVDGGVLHGWVARVGDGDGVRIVHVPFLRRIAGRAGGKVKAGETISVRLAGVDAPECAHFGNKGQVYGKKARDWLKSYVHGQHVRVHVHSMDQYRRIVGTVYRKHPNALLRNLHLGTRNVSLELTRAGYATVYQGAGAQYGGMKTVYESAEAVARKKGIGMWAAKKVVLPGEFKKSIRNGSGDVAKKVSSRAMVAPKGKAAQRGSGDSPFVLFELARQSFEFLKGFRKP